MSRVRGKIVKKRNMGKFGKRPKYSLFICPKLTLSRKVSMADFRANVLKQLKIFINDTTHPKMYRTVLVENSMKIISLDDLHSKS